MAEDEIKKIIEKRELLRQEIEKIDNFLELYRELIGTETVRIEAHTNSRGENVRAHYRRRARTAKPADIGPMARRILLEHGKPMTRSELLAALQERDVVLAGEDKAKYLGTVLWRMKEAFVNIDGHGYWPRDVEYAEAGYSPSAEQRGIGRLGTLFLNSRNGEQSSSDE